MWQASTDNGDKPGIGLRLVQGTGNVTATFFVLDPNKPHDFSAGRPFPTEVLGRSASELRLAVQLDETRKDEMVIQLQGPLEGERVGATLQEVREGAQAIALTFVRQA